MNIIEEMLKEIPSSDLDEQVKRLCDSISDEEGPAEHVNYTPVGPNIFLAIETKGTMKHEISFLCVEREMKEKYIISRWSGYPYKEEQRSFRVASWELTTENTATKILIAFAKKLKYFKGE